MEEELQVALFHRNTRNVSLTREGVLFLEECRRVLSQFEHALRQGHAITSGQIGELSVGVSDFSILSFVPDLVSVFRKDHPGIDLRLFDMEREEQIAAVARGELDIGFTLGPVQAPGIESQAITQEPLVALLSRDHRLARRASLKLTELSSEPFVLGSRRGWHAYRLLLDHVFDAAGFIPRVTQEVYQTIEIFGLVAAGLGVSLYPTCARQLQTDRLVVKKLADVTHSVMISAIWHPESHSKAATHLVDFIKGMESRRTFH